MATDIEFVKMLRQTIYGATPISVSQAGDVIYGNAVSIAARVEPMNKLIDTSPTGEQSVSEFRIFTLAAIGAKDHVWLPGVDRNNIALARMPKQISPQTDEDGSISHYEVYV